MVYDARAETEPLQALSGKTDQSEYAALWSAFFHQIGIKERENPACQRTRLPFRCPEIYDGISVRFQPFKFG